MVCRRIIIFDNPS